MLIKHLDGGVVVNKAVEMAQVCRLKLKPSVPFNFTATVSKPSHYQSAIVFFEDEKLYQTLRIGRSLFGIVLSDSGSDVNHPEVTLAVYARPGVKLSQKEKDEIIAEITFRYNLDADISDFNHTFRADKALAGPVRRLRGMRPSCAYSLYEFLMITTMLQNTIVKRSISMTGAMLKSFGTRISFAGKEVYAIWEPKAIEKTTEEHLRELRIGYRSKIIKRISQVFAEGTVDEASLRKMDKKDTKKFLLSIYGVGPQSVSYLLFEYFHHYDALDHLSPWEGKILSMLLYGNKSNPPEDTVELLKQRYGQWSALAVHYLFEDVFWQRTKKTIPWLEEEIRD